ncbi:hypothetical protein MLAC_09410 [Mycobacterium lacus]|uniref:Uncharacterized protein n=1 Tax=Mycobacterium lacus TaxID=169765 RepID=A0A7I7NJH4_9MYCO|nr:hypothetical protein MLAC_09410 [Mycobacterium lacus]
MRSDAELDAAAAYVDDLGIWHEPVKDIGPSYILELRGPDSFGTHGTEVADTMFVASLRKWLTGKNYGNQFQPHHRCVAR